MTETEKMLSGMIYDTSDKELAKRRTLAHKLSKDFNDTYEDEEEKRAEILKELLPNLGKGSYIQGPIQFDYGCYTTFGENCFANFNLTVLDCCPITIGNDVFFGPTVCSQRLSTLLLQRKGKCASRRTAPPTTLNMLLP